MISPPSPAGKSGPSIFALSDLFAAAEGATGAVGKECAPHALLQSWKKHGFFYVRLDSETQQHVTRTFEMVWFLDLAKVGQRVECYIKYDV
jgi:hypothetical protein